MLDSEMIQTVAQILADRGVGTWRPSGPAFAAGEVGIFYGPIGEHPDCGVGITAYGRMNDETNDGGDETRLVQVRVRGTADDLASQVDAVLHRMTRVRGLSASRASGPVPLGPDGNGRPEMTLNYQVQED